MTHPPGPLFHCLRVNGYNSSFPTALWQKLSGEQKKALGLRQEDGGFPSFQPPVKGISPSSNLNILVTRSSWREPGVGPEMGISTLLHPGPARSPKPPPRCWSDASVPHTWVAGLLISRGRRKEPFPGRRVQLSFCYGGAIRVAPSQQMALSLYTQELPGCREAEESACDLGSSPHLVCLRTLQPPQ